MTSYAILMLLCYNCPVIGPLLTIFSFVFRSAKRFEELLKKAQEPPGAPPPPPLPPPPPPPPSPSQLLK